MLKQKNVSSLQALMEAWQQKGLVSSKEKESIDNFSLTYKRFLPLYMRILIAVGALFSVSFLIGFFYAAHIIDSESTTAKIVWGLIFVVLAIVGGNYAKNKNTTVGHSFLIQTSFCAMWLGKLLFLMGFSKLLNSYMGYDASMTVSLLLITLPTYFLYSVSLDRFISALATLVYLLMAITDQFSYVSKTPLILNLTFLIQVALVAFLFMNKNTKNLYIPLAYAIAYSLAITVIYFSLGNVLDSWRHQVNYNFHFINIILVLSLIGVITYTAKALKIFLKEPLILAGVGVILLGSISEPGILLALCFMIVGYERHEKALLILGMVLLPMVLFFYYYNLEVTLLMKSIILTSTGLLLLAARGYLSFRKLDREV